MLASFWNDFLASVVDQKDKNPLVYSLLEQLKPVSLKDKKITLSTPNQGTWALLQRRAPLVENFLSSYLNKKVDIEIIIRVPKKKQAPAAPLLQFEPNTDDAYHKAGISGKLTFDNFCVSSTNQVAYAASQAVAKDPGRSYNPLFLWGGVGVGKTHLSQAIAQKVLAHDPEKKVLFCPGDLFINELVEAIRGKSTQGFRKKYRRLDLLIVDDVQFIAGKNAVQDEFFHTFNSVVSAGGQIVLTSDRPPSEINKLADRLRSRFSGGLTVDIQPPDFELRTAILLIKAQEKNMEIDIDCAKVIAEQIADTRGLEGTLLTIYAQAVNSGRVVDLDLVEEFFSNSKKVNGPTKRLTAADVVKTICSYYDIKQSHLKSPTRTESLAFPRQVAMYLLRNELGLKYEEVAFILKRKDHTTVIHGENKISKMLMKDASFKLEVDKIVQALRQST